MNAPAAARTYRIGFVFAHAVSTRSWWELGWAVVVICIFLSAVWKAAYRIDVQRGMVEFRSILWRRSVPLRHVRWIRACVRVSMFRSRA